MEVVEAISPRLHPSTPRELQVHVSGPQDPEINIQSKVGDFKPNAELDLLPVMRSAWLDPQLD